MLSCKEYQIWSKFFTSLAKYLRALQTDLASPIAIGSENFQRPCMTTFHRSRSNNWSGKTENGTVGVITRSGCGKPFTSESCMLSAKPGCSALALRDANSSSETCVTQTPKPPWSSSLLPIASVANIDLLKGKSIANSMNLTAHAICNNSTLTEFHSGTTEPWNLSMKP